MQLKRSRMSKSVNKWSAYFPTLLTKLTKLSQKWGRKNLPFWKSCSFFKILILSLILLHQFWVAQLSGAIQTWVDMSWMCSPTHHALESLLIVYATLKTLLPASLVSCELTWIQCVRSCARVLFDNTVLSKSLGNCRSFGQSFFLFPSFFFGLLYQTSTFDHFQLGHYQMIIQL